MNLVLQPLLTILLVAILWSFLQSLQEKRRRYQYWQQNGAYMRPPEKLIDVAELAKKRAMIHYPRPRPLHTVTDCGCPYTCNTRYLKGVSKGSKDCMTWVKLQLNRYGEEAACTFSVNRGMCLEPCNPATCPKPPLAKYPVSEKLTPLEHRDDVVIVTKILGPGQELNRLKQSLCLLTAAYNDRVNYDIVVFLSSPIGDKNVEDFKALVHPAKITFTRDQTTVQDIIKQLSQEKQDAVRRNCKKTPETLGWMDKCNPLRRYLISWHDRFLVNHVWEHPALTSYRYMLWINPEAYCTRQWQRDPVSILVDNEAVLATVHISKTARSQLALHQNIREHTNEKSICRVVEGNGIVQSIWGNCTRKFELFEDSVFVADMNFFRSHSVWLKKFSGENTKEKLDKRKFIPTFQETALVLTALKAPKGLRHLESSGAELNVMYNGEVAGRKVSLGAYEDWFKMYAKRDFENGHDKCSESIDS